MATIAAAVLATAAPAATPAERQAAYQAAQAAYDQGDWAAAAKGFAPVLLPDGRSGHSDGLIRARYALALSYLDRDEEAIAQATRAVTELDGKPIDDDRAEAYIALGRIRLTAMEMREALDAYKHAVAAMPPDSPLRTSAEVGQIHAAMVIDPGHAYRTASAIIADPARLAAMSKTVQAEFFTLQARALLNSGDAKGAIVPIRRALAVTGVATTSVTVGQSQARGDAALIYLRAGQPDQARRVLAYSGGGYMPDSNWIGTYEGELPVCGDEVRPDDVAVVELRIGDDGHVLLATPIYASRPGEMGLIFARTARSWVWQAKTIADVKPFWRTALRLEMRCLTRPRTESLMLHYATTNEEWFRARGVDIAQTRSSNAGIIQAARQDAKLQPVAELINGVGQGRKVVPDDVARRIADALLTAGAPLDVALMYELSQSAPQRLGMRRWARASPARLAQIGQRYALLPGGERIGAWAYSEAAIALETKGDFAAARPLLEAVGHMSPEKLPAQDPIRLVALLHLSLVDRQLGKAAEADARLRQAGLDAEQCALFDVRPLPVNQSVSASAFPGEALRWAMEGFAKSAFDITADGSVTNVRTVLAYPAFVFGENTVKAVSRFRYLAPTLNNVPLGCSSNQIGINYRMPDR